MFRPSLSVKDREGADVKNVDFIPPNAVPTPDNGPLLGVRRAAGGLSPRGGGEEEVSPTHAEAKSPTATVLGWRSKDGGTMDFVLPNAVSDNVPNIGSLLDSRAGSSNPQGGGGEEFTPMCDDEANSPTVLGWRSKDGGTMDFVLPNAVSDNVPNIGSLLDSRAGSSNPQGGGGGGGEEEEFTPMCDDEANSPTEKSQKKPNKLVGCLKRKWDNFTSRFLQNDQVETLIPSELNADPANPNLKDGADLASPELNDNISPDKRKGFFDWLWRGKVESLPTPQLKADPAIPDVREVVDLESPQSKTNVCPKKHKQKASKSRLFNLQKKKVKTVVPTQQLNADLAIPVGMDGADPASPESETKIRPDKLKALKRCFLCCCWTGEVESMPTSQLQADPAIPVGMDGADLAKREVKTHNIVSKKMQKDDKCPGPKDFRGLGRKDSRARSAEKLRLKEGKSGLKAEINFGSGHVKDHTSPADAEPVPFPGTSSSKGSVYLKYHLAKCNPLGQGSFGKVLKGIRRSDGKEVAIKLIRRSKEDKYLVIPGYTEPLLTEVALLLQMKRSPISPFVIEMYDWYEETNWIKIVMEYPQPCETMKEFLSSCGPQPESIARPIMHRVVQAVQDCLNHGVFHTDVHLGNILLNRENMTLKLIDFGAGHLFTNDAYDSKDFIGALEFTPPEVYTDPKYYAIPANVWALGVLMYCMAYKRYPAPEYYLSQCAPLQLDENISKELCDLIKRCLALKPTERPTIQQILDHDWFKIQ